MINVDDYISQIMDDYKSLYPEVDSPRAIFAYKSDSNYRKGNSHNNRIITIAARDVIIKSGKPMQIPYININLGSNGIKSTNASIRYLLSTKYLNCNDKAFLEDDYGFFWPNDIPKPTA